MFFIDDFIVVIKLPALNFELSFPRSIGEVLYYAD